MQEVKELMNTEFCLPCLRVEGNLSGEESETQKDDEIQSLTKQLKECTHEIESLLKTLEKMEMK